MGTVRPRRRPHSPGEGGKSVQRCARGSAPLGKASHSPALGSGAHHPLRGRPAGAGKRRGVRARACWCGMLRVARGCAHVDSGAQRPAALRPATACLRQLGAGVPGSSQSLAGVVGSARIQRRSAPRAARSRLSKLGAPSPKPVRPAGTGFRGNRPPQAGNPRWVRGPLARDGRQVAPKGAASGLGAWDGAGRAEMNPARSVPFPPFLLSSLRSSGSPNAPRGHRGSLHPPFNVLAPLVESSPLIRSRPQFHSLKSRHAGCGFG